ncbi:MAG: OadG family protein [Bacteroidetes bacterium]|nr:OadG family protein [Bacteroidota bacterium]
MHRILTSITAFSIGILFFLHPLAAQEAVQGTAYQTPYEPYDPLIPQSFAFDKKHEIFAGINTVDNEIVIVSHKGDGKLSITHRFLVDLVKGRHDFHHIYRPKSVAIYDGYVSFLASHRDSCYFAVLNLEGQLVKKLTFPGYASAFSFSPSAKELYISGENATGFDVIVLDTRNGVSSVELKEVSTLHYQKPRMSEQIAVRDPHGIAIAVIAMSVVFSALILLYLIFRQVGVQMMAAARRRNLKKQRAAAQPETIIPSEELSEAAFAAIAAAIHLYSEELHDLENAVLTINKVSRSYSPWSSKIYGLNPYFNKR